MFLPDSYVLTSNSVSGAAYVDRINDHIQNTSTKFNHNNTVDDTNNSGDIGVAFSMINDTWDAAVFWDSSASRIKAWIDPTNAITNPIDPSSGSTDASPAVEIGADDGTNVGDGDTYQTEFLWAEYDDGFVLIQKGDVAGEDIQVVGTVGRTYQPFFTDDASQNLDGLSIVAFNGTNFNIHVSTARLGSSNWASPASVVGRPNEVTDPLSNGRVRPVPYVLKDSSGSNQWLGPMKWAYAERAGRANLDRIEDSNGTGGLLICTSSGAGGFPFATPWDPSTTPT